MRTTLASAPSPIRTSSELPVVSSYAVQRGLVGQARVEGPVRLLLLSGQERQHRLTRLVRTEEPSAQPGQVGTVGLDVLDQVPTEQHLGLAEAFRGAGDEVGTARRPSVVQDRKSVV